VKILVIPDTQVKDGVPLDHLDWCGQYIVDKKPDVVLHLGDFADMESLSSYDIGKKSFEGRRYTTDVQVAKEAMGRLMKPLRLHNARQVKNHEQRYWPDRVILLGNHEDRINRAIENDPKLEGLISTDDLGYAEYGWRVVPFLEPIVIEGVAFSHYFPSGMMGRPCISARMLLTKKHMSCVAGHQQGRDIAYGQRADGTNMTAIIAGSFYLHDEKYLNHQTNKHWRGVYMLHEVKDGSFDEMPVSIEYLKRKYG
jgi:hypothetical protein